MFGNAHNAVLIINLLNREATGNKTKVGIILPAKMWITYKAGSIIPNAILTATDLTYLSLKETTALESPAAVVTTTLIS